MFVYIKGPSVVNGVGAEYYIDDFSLVVQGLRLKNIGFPLAEQLFLR